MKIPKIQISQKPTYKKFDEDVDFFSLFERIEKEFPNCFIFESLGEEGKYSRYSIIGFDPRHLTSGKDDLFILDQKTITTKNPYDLLKILMPEQTIARLYAGGLVGYVSYEAVNYFEQSVSLKVHPLFDQFQFGVYTDGLVLDKVTNQVFYFFYDTDRSALLKKILRRKTKRGEFSIKYLGDTSSKKDHKKAVEVVKEEIRKGNTFQCEVGFKSEFEIKGDTLQIYERLRRVNPSPFMYYMKFEGRKIIGASPELLLSLRDGELASYPLAGTIGRGRSGLEDKRFARDLLQDPKEVAEHTMLVDLQRNDLGKISEFGTVRVRSFLDIKKFSHVQHISSEIVGVKKRGEDMFSALKATMPAGTLSGAPKIESMKIIDRMEKHARGPYGGALGHFGFNGDCTFAIPIRTLFISGTYAYTQTSGGIVADSDPQKEYEEIQKKLAAMKEVLSI